MTKPNRVFLIGPMGAGKTTIGRQLATQLGMTFADSDQEIQDRTGVDINTIFEYEGETGFRHREETVIDEMTLIDRQVLATGGGAVLRSQNRHHLASRGIVLYLQCSPEQQYQRICRGRNRPLVNTDKPLEKLRNIMTEREPFYLETADHTFSTENRSTNAVVRDILTLFSSPTK